MVTSRSVRGASRPSPDAGGDGSGRPGRLERRTTRQLLTAGVCVALVSLAALAAAGVWVFSRSATISDDLLDRGTPALVDSVRLESALVDQETGVRGYGLTGQEDFLAPYRSGLSEQKQSVSGLEALVRGNAPELRDLRRVLDDVRLWQQRIADPVVAAPPGAPITLATRRADEGKTEFDAVRSALTNEQNHLQADRTRTRAELNRVNGERDLVLGLIAAALVALTVLVFVGLRRGVTGPLEQLSQDVRTVARGDFGHQVALTGPVDLRRLAADVDAMRRRLAEELLFTNEARERLDEQASDLRRSNAELEQFAYVASHDLQEPLRKVASFCQLLERRYADQLDERAGQYIAFAVDGANRMQGLINDLLAFSRVGRLHTDHAPVDLEALLARTQDALSIAVEEAGARVTHDPLPTVEGDATQLGMVLQNLLSNALKFRSPDRSPTIHVSVERRGELWEFSVSDNGIGIDQAYAEKIFVIFQRLHTRDSYPGNGIGLALCKKIVEYHGGTIDCDPDHTPGARMIFTLPATPDQDPEPDTLEADVPGAEAPPAEASEDGLPETVSPEAAVLEAAPTSAADVIRSEAARPS